MTNASPSTAEELLAAAYGMRELEAPPGDGGAFTRGCVVLMRQGLEMAIEQAFADSEPGVLATTAMRSRLLCLPLVVEAPTARTIDHIWRTLSRSCHHNGYELAPTSAEIDDWLARVSAALDSLRQAQPLSV